MICLVKFKKKIKTLNNILSGNANSRADRPPFTFIFASESLPPSSILKHI